MECMNEVIEKYLTEHESEMFEDLKYLVSFPSVISEPQENAPFGLECARCLEAAMNLFRRDGFETETFAQSGYALAYYGKKPEIGDKYTAVLTHSDVVPVIPEDWILTSPFEMKDNGDLVIGRGVADDKHAVIGLLYILRAYRDAGFIPGHTVSVFIGSNEETGMRDVRNFKKEQPIPAVAVVPDGSYPVSFGERGSFRATVRSKEKLKDITYLQGGNAANTVMGAAVCRIRTTDALRSYLESNRKEWLEYAVIGEETEISAKGVSSHGGRPYNGDSALRRLAEYLSGFGGLCETDAEIIKELSLILGDCYGENLGISRDSAEMGRLTDANGKVWLEDGILAFTLDIRFGPGVDKEETKESLRANLEGRGFTVDAAKGSNAFKIDPEDPLAKTFLGSFRKYSGKEDATYFYMSGGTYSKVLNPECRSFSTGVSYGKYTDRIDLPKGHGKVHESDEVLGKKELIRGLCILGGIIADLDAAY